MKPPTVRQLLGVIPSLEVRVVKKAMKDGQAVAGHIDDTVVTLSLAEAKKWSRADSLVTTLIHEATHAYFAKDYPGPASRPEESTTRRWEMALFKSRVLREAALVRIVNATLFGE
jgi:hypothetical protein